MNIGLALGGGAARGWAHIGIIEALEGMGIMPSVICGTSIGALVGASCAAGNLDRLKGSVLSLTRLGSFIVPGCSSTPEGAAPLAKNFAPYSSQAIAIPMAFFAIAIGE